MSDTAIGIVSEKEADSICLTDIACHRDAQRTNYLIQNWLRNRNTIEFPGVWEQLNNPGFNPIEFDGIKKGLRILEPVRPLIHESVNTSI